MFNHCSQAPKTLQLHCEKYSMWALPRCKYNVSANLYLWRLWADLCAILFLPIPINVILLDENREQWSH